MAKILIEVDVPSLDEDTICNLVMGEGLTAPSIFADLFIVDYAVTATNEQGVPIKGEETIGCR